MYALFFFYVLLAFGQLTFTVFYASSAEWMIHRFMMHRPILGFAYAFRTHALTHHRIFKADYTYHLQRDEDKETIPMAWWNGPVLVVLATMPTIPFSWYFNNRSLSVLAFVILCLYYGAYEYAHWCMHLPRKRSIERSGIFFRLNGHHILHHRYMATNFNVVLPLADLCFGTLLLRSKVCFAQALGPAVPNVQPLPSG